MIERQSGHLARLIDDLLDVSRINRGLIELRREAVPVSSLLLQAVEASKSVLDRAGHRLTLQLPDDSAKVELPLVKVPVPEDALVQDAGPTFAPEKGMGRILVVEDNVDGLETLTRLLEAEGHEVAAKLRAECGLTQARLVALTGWGAQRDREKTPAAGFDAHLTKPIDPDVLLQFLEECLADQQAR